MIETLIASMAFIVGCLMLGLGIESAAKIIAKAIRPPEPESKQPTSREIGQMQRPDPQ